MLGSLLDQGMEIVRWLLLAAFGLIIFLVLIVVFVRKARKPPDKSYESSPDNTGRDR